MTKPVTAAAAMILVEQGKLRLDDPVDRWLPELANRKVLLAIDALIHQTVPARRAITLRDLLTFRCGYGMIPVFPDRYPIQKAIAEAGFAPGPVFPSFPPDELMRRYGSLPLIYQPGERWLYNSGTEILGVLIARVADVTFGEFLRDRIFAPLGMKDTAFYVPADKQHRFATCYARDPATQKLKVFDLPVTGKFSSPPVFENGSAGLVSTADDFNAFAQMLLNGGNLGKRTHPVAGFGRADDDGPDLVGEQTGIPIVPGRRQRLGFRNVRLQGARRSRCQARPVRLGRRLWDVLVFRPRQATHRHSADPADDGFAAAAARIYGFLDLRSIRPSTIEPPQSAPPVASAGGRRGSTRWPGQVGNYL